jgi:hypothetical protein
VEALAALDAAGANGVPVACAQNGVESERLALRRRADVYGVCVMCPAAHLRPGVVQAFSVPSPRDTRRRAVSRRGRRRGRGAGHGLPDGHLPRRGAGRHHAVEVHQAPHEPGQRGRGPGRAVGPRQRDRRAGAPGRVAALTAPPASISCPTTTSSSGAAISSGPRPSAAVPDRAARRGRASSGAPVASRRTI